jgi:nucleoside-diphosphate-sugar epimerase
MKIAIAGASGFVGQLLIQELAKDFQVVGLGRSQIESQNSNIEYRRCDLFSLLQIEIALGDIDIAIYLVHSMLPTARLTQSTFEDSDLLLADNFARAASKCNIKRVIYLSGIIPLRDQLSKHLASRLEVENTLRNYKVNLTTLRSGLILGAQGSSFRILKHLVQRLPVLICPRWTYNRTQCIDSADVVNLIRFCVENEESTSNQTFDIGCEEVVTYLDLMKMVAELLHLKRFFVKVAFFSPGLSKLWVKLITGASSQLVNPLVDSLQHEMLVQNSKLIESYGKRLTSLKSSLQKSLVETSVSLRQSAKLKLSRSVVESRVRSIQRLPLPIGKTAEWVGHEYFHWLPSFLSPFIVTFWNESKQFEFRLRWLNVTLLTLEPSPARSTVDRSLYYIVGGLLMSKTSSENSRLEFREVANSRQILAAIHDYTPSLPWYLYTITQALAHLWVMKGFKKYLQKLSA